MADSDSAIRPVPPGTTDLGFLGRHLRRIDVARDVAWALAQELGRTPAGGWDAVIARRDGEVAAVGRALYPLHGIPGHVQNWIHAAESTDIRYNIQVVAE